MEWCAVSAAGCHYSADDGDGLGGGSRGAALAGHDEDAEPCIWPDMMMLRNSGTPVWRDFVLDVDVFEPTDMVA